MTRILLTAILVALLTGGAAAAEKPYQWLLIGPKVADFVKIKIDGVVTLRAERDKVCPMQAPEKRVPCVDAYSKLVAARKAERRQLEAIDDIIDDRTTADAVRDGKIEAMAKIYSAADAKTSAEVEETRKLYPEKKVGQL